MIRSILQRSVDHREIQQHDIQALIWAILARTKVSQLSHGLQLVAATLLTPQEILQVNGGALGLIPESVRQKAYANLPPLLRQTLEAEARLREELTRTTASYEEIEKVAVLFGEAPRGEGSRDVPEGRWSYHPEGYFVRYLPKGYPQTRIIVYRPEQFSIERDKLGRIARLTEAEGNRIEATYDDAIEPLKIPSDPDLRGYAFKSVRLVQPFPANPQKGQQAVWNDAGWALVKASGAKSELSGTRRKAPERYSDWEQRVQQARQWEKEIGKLRPQGSPEGDREGSFELALNLLSLQKGIGAAAASGRPGKPAWFSRRLDSVFNAVQLELCRGAGGCAPEATKAEGLRSQPERGLGASSFLAWPEGWLGRQGALLAGPPEIGMVALISGPAPWFDPQSSGGAGPTLPEYDPSGQVAVPGNTARQRLSQSARPAEPDCAALESACERARRWAECAQTILGDLLSDVSEARAEALVEKGTQLPQSTAIPGWYEQFTIALDRLQQRIMSAQAGSDVERAEIESVCAELPGPGDASQCSQAAQRVDALEKKSREDLEGALNQEMSVFEASTPLAGASPAGIKLLASLQNRLTLLHLCQY